MIKKVLELIYAGKTIPEIEKELKMEHSALMGMLEHMVKLGYLSREMPAASCERNDASICARCPLKKVCVRMDTVIYTITPKGINLLKRN